MKQWFKGALICGGLAMCATSFAESAKGVKVLPMGGKCYGMSDNGQWIITTETGTTAYLYNDETGEVIDLLTNEISSCEANDVSDAGIVVGNAADAPAYYENGEWHYLELPTDFEAGDCKVISPDGSTIYGVVYSGFYYTPVIWRNKTVEFLEVLPKDPFNKLPAGGFVLDCVTATGDKIMGRVIDSNYDWYPILWEDGKPSYPFMEYYKDENGRPTTYQMTVGNFSPNGRYGVLDLIDYSMAGGTHYPHIYDFKEEVMSTVEGDLLCLVDNVGRAFSCTPAATLYRTAYVHENDVTTTMEDWLMQRHGIDMFEGGQLEVSGTPLFISADGRKIAGIGNTDGVVNTYLVNLGSYEDNITENYTTAPTVISRNADIFISAEAGSSVTIVDLAGRMVYNKKMDDTRLSTQMPEGTYIVKVVQNNQAYTFKTMVTI